MFFLFTNQADELWQYCFLNRENDKAYIYSCFLFVCEMFMLITCRLLLEKSCYLSSGATRTTYDYD